jgi:hypothetical protein
MAGSVETNSELAASARNFQYVESGVVLDYGKGGQYSTLNTWARCVGLWESRRVNVSTVSTRETCRLQRLACRSTQS